MTLLGTPKREPVGAPLVGALGGHEARPYVCSEQSSRSSRLGCDVYFTTMLTNFFGTTMTLTT